MRFLIYLTFNIKNYIYLKLIIYTYKEDKNYYLLKIFNNYYI